mgnify:CR=1 FL=1
MTSYNKYIIIYTSLFQNELEKILKYIAFNLNSPNIAKSFYKEITANYLLYNAFLKDIRKLIIKIDF